MRVKNNINTFNVNQVDLTYRNDNYLSQAVKEMNTKDVMIEFEGLDEAMDFAKKLRHFITVTSKLRRYNKWTSIMKN